MQRGGMEGGEAERYREKEKDGERDSEK